MARTANCPIGVALGRYYVSGLVLEFRSAFMVAATAVQIRGTMLELMLEFLCLGFAIFPKMIPTSPVLQPKHILMANLVHPSRHLLHLSDIQQARYLPGIEVN